jgi:hypothetical protein
MGARLVYHSKRLVLDGHEYNSSIVGDARWSQHQKNHETVCDGTYA